MNRLIQPQRGTRQRGIVSVVVLIVLMLITAMIAQYARRAVGDRRHTRLQMQHQQAIQLAEAGLRRAVVNVAEDAEFQSETWQIPAGVIHQTNIGSVQISVLDGQATAVARYPANVDNPVRVTKTAVLKK